jgi:hypothetical protein
MNIAKLEQKLLAAGRARSADERVPFAFEKRVMARLPRRQPADGGAAWARALWRAAVPCVAVAVGLCALALSLQTGAPHQPTLSEELETAVYAALDYPETPW